MPSAISSLRACKSKATVGEQRHSFRAYKRAQLARPTATRASAQSLISAERPPSSSCQGLDLALEPDADDQEMTEESDCPLVAVAPGPELCVCPFVALPLRLAAALHCILSHVDEIGTWVTPDGVRARPEPASVMALRGCAPRLH